MKNERCSMIGLKSFLWGTSVIGCLLLNMALCSDKFSSAPLPKLIPRELLFGNPEKASPRLSPDGNKMAYLAPNASQVLNVWIRDLQKPSSKDIQITSDQKRGIRQFLWQLDNQSILYLQDNDGDENYHLYQTNIQTKVTKDLTPFANVQVQILAYDPHYPTQLLLQMNKRQPTLFDVYRLNLSTGELESDTENEGDVIEWIEDNQMQIRLSQSYMADGSTLIRIRNDKQDPWREWLKILPTDHLSIKGFSADSQFLYAITDIGINTASLFKINLATGERSLVVEDPTYDVSSVLINPFTYEIEAVGIERDRHEWQAMDPNIKADFEKLKHSFKGTFSLVSRDLKNQKWVISITSDRRPTCFYLYDRATKQLELLFSTQPKLEEYDLSPMESIQYQARDGMTLHGYLTAPVGYEKHDLPAVLLVHGGPWVRDSWGLQPTVQWLANRGYVVLQINYRGSTGYGKAYLNAGNREWANKMHTDLLDGKQWLIQQKYVNPNKVAIFGGSYGGYATLVGLTFTPDAFCCGVDIVGPSNLITLIKTLPPYWVNLKPEMDLRIGNLETEEEFLKSRSPLFKVDQITKPLLIAQGANDPRVKQTESDQIVAEMRKKQLPVEYLLFKDEGHGFAQPQNRLRFYAAAENFLARYAGGRQVPPNAEEIWDSFLKN
jgi:dipeptidyl aminopeptidase/acylaminoacyl peptidase